MDHFPAPLETVEGQSSPDSTDKCLDLVFISHGYK